MKRETYEEIVERRMNERSEGLRRSIELWEKERGVNNGKTVKGDVKGHAPERK